MKQTAITISIIAISAGLLGAVVWGSQQDNSPTAPVNDVVEISTGTEDSDQVAGINDDETPITAGTDYYYWGTTCPYCHDVIDWMDENQIDDQLDIVRKEVYENQQNSAELSQRAQSCGMGERVGVPFMYTSGGECIVGSTPIIEYLEQKLEQQSNAGGTAEELLEDPAELEQTEDETDDAMDQTMGEDTLDSTDEDELDVEDEIFLE